MNIAQAIIRLFPDARLDLDFIVQDDSDGNGPYIALWGVKDSDGNDADQPTEEELEAAWEELQSQPQPEQKTEAERLTGLEQELAELRQVRAENEDLMNRLGDVEMTIADLLLGI